jgi:hypothetical protein
MIYDALCDGCGLTFAYTRSIDQRHDVPECVECGSIHTKMVILRAPMGVVTGKFDPFVSPVDGSVITTKRELNEHNKRNRVVQLAEGYTEDKVLKGDFGQKKVELDKAELSSDIQEATHAVVNGYKPTVKVQEDE